MAVPADYIAFLDVSNDFHWLFTQLNANLTLEWYGGSIFIQYSEVAD